MSVVLDNSALFNLCRKHLKIKQSNHFIYNRLSAKVISGAFCTSRFEGETYRVYTWEDYMTNLLILFH